MLTPSTCLQHLGDSEVLLKKKRRSDTLSLSGSQRRPWSRSPRKLVCPRYRLPELEGDHVLGNLLFATSCGDEQPLTLQTMWGGAVQVTPDCPQKTEHSPIVICARVW